MHDNFHLIGPPAFNEEENKKAKAIQNCFGVAEVGMPAHIPPFRGEYSGLCDTSEYSWNAPYATAWIAMSMSGCGWHNWGITRCAGDTMGGKSMDKGADLIALTGLDVLLDPEMLDKAKNELKERLNGKEYTSLLPDDYEVPIHLNEEIMAKYS